MQLSGYSLFNSHVYSIIYEDFLYHYMRSDMNYTFGELVLSLYTLIDGKSLSYGYSNREMPNEVRDFQILFRSMLTKYIENHDDASKHFLDLCVDHIQDISNEKFEFLNKASV